MFIHPVGQEASPILKQIAVNVKKELVMTDDKDVYYKNTQQQNSSFTPTVTKYWFTGEINTGQRVRLVITSLSNCAPFSILL
jgi:hypothetical protein